MTIDERLEALVQSVELLASMHKDNDKAILALQAGIGDLKDAALALLTVAGSHERRLQRLEGENGQGAK